MSTMILNDLKRQYSLHADEYKQKAIEVLDSGWYILGKDKSDPCVASRWYIL